MEDVTLGSTTRNGLIGQTFVLGRLVELGYDVLLPWNPDSSYDLAYYVEKEEQKLGSFTHTEGQFVRVQCKTAWISKDGSFLTFNTSTASFGGPDVWKKKRTGYRGKADWFGVYSPDTNKIYMISVWEAPDASHMVLRLMPPRNNQKQGIRWAKDYEI